MSRIKETIVQSKNVLNVYLTAGYPNLEDTIPIVKSLSNAGVSLIEIGMPFSDPMADGPTIQASSQIAIRNGITIEKIFDQIRTIRQDSSIPIILMGYYNQMLQYGSEEFLRKAKEVGVDGFILPDLPLEVYQSNYKSIFQELQLDMIFLVTPQTSTDRIRLLDSESSGFLYVVSSHSITGTSQHFETTQIAYFKRLHEMKLKNKLLVGFGISNRASFKTACQYADGAIIGSAFIKHLQQSTDLEKSCAQFVQSILND